MEITWKRDVESPRKVAIEKTPSSKHPGNQIPFSEAVPQAR